MTTDLKNELIMLADTEAPFSTVDIARARQDGRRRMLTGRLAAASTGVAVVAACGLAVGGLAGGTDAAAHPAAGGGAPAAQAPAVQKAAAFTGTDPLSAHASFGNLPTGWHLGTVEDGSDYGNHISAFSGADPATGTYANLQVTDKRRAAGMFDPYATSEPATIPGSDQAEYITIPVRDKVYPTPVYILQWKTSKGTWAVLAVNRGGSRDASLALLDSLAAGVTFDDTAVPLPLHIDGLPKDLAASTQDSQELNVPGSRGKAFQVQLVFRGGGSQVVITAEPLLPAALPQTAPSGISTPPVLDASSKVDYACKEDNGLKVCASVAPAARDSVGDAKSLLDHITSLGTDKAQWTTHVVG